jgi:hypothetical protein
VQCAVEEEKEKMPQPAAAAGWNRHLLKPLTPTNQAFFQNTEILKIPTNSYKKNISLSRVNLYSYNRTSFSFI